jgi:hypothetical protein
MGYAEGLLAPGESIVHRSHQHWLSLVLESRVAIVLWAVAAIGIVITIVANLRDTARDVATWVTGAAIVLGLIVVAWRWWQWRNEEYVITNRRLLKVTGILNKRSADSSLEKINDAILEENVLGRLLDYGDLDILTAAEVAVDRYRMLNHAKEFKKQMLSAKHALESGIGYSDSITPPIRTTPQGAPGGPTPPPAAPAPPPVDRVDTAEEVTAALTRLAQLRDQGAISASDYELKKRDLLGRL